MRRQPQQQRSRVMVETIIEAGFISLQRHGMEGTTTRHIADIAGVSPGTLYHYFPDKEAVYEAMYSELVRALIAELRDLQPLVVKLERRQALHLLIRHLRDWLEKDSGRYLKAVNCNDALYGREMMRQFERAMRDLALQYMMHNPELLQLRDVSLTSYVINTCCGAGMLRYLGRAQPPMGFDAFADGMVNMICSYLDSELALVRASAEPKR